MTSSLPVRMIRGGLWIKFNTQDWTRCSWAHYPGSDGYIINPHDGGMFHVNYSGIIEIENYIHGHTNAKSSL